MLDDIEENSQDHSSNRQHLIGGMDAEIANPVNLDKRYFQELNQLERNKAEQ